MKKYEIVVEDDSAVLLAELLHSLPYVKEIKQKDVVNTYTLASESSLSDDWMSEEDEELQRMYKK